jgi:predicted membrane chloride channel (bestrophin family)
VYRTTQAYNRWWDARKIWGTILNRVRDINTQVCRFAANKDCLGFEAILCFLQYRFTNYCKIHSSRSRVSSNHSFCKLQAAVFISEEDTEMRKGIQNWSIAFARTLEAHLQVCVYVCVYV